MVFENGVRVVRVLGSQRVSPEIYVLHFWGKRFNSFPKKLKKRKFSATIHGFYYIVYAIPKYLFIIFEVGAKWLGKLWGRNWLRKCLKFVYRERENIYNPKAFVKGGLVNAYNYAIEMPQKFNIICCHLYPSMFSTSRI